MAGRVELRAHYRTQRVDARSVGGEVLLFRRAAPVSRSLLGDLLSGGSQVPPPDALLPFHLASPEERTRRVRRVLVRALALYRAGAPSMLLAINDAAEGGAEGEYAKMQLRRVLHDINLPAWEQHPARLRADVRSLLTRTIGKLTPHRGGWLVGRPSSTRAA